MKAAIVYDWVNRNRGGAERVLTSLHEIWPKAPLFTSVYNSRKAVWAEKFPEVKTGFVNNLPLAKKRAYWYYPLLIMGFEQFNFDEFDLVISVSTGPAKAIITKPETTHICYCLTPPRRIYNKNCFPFNLAQKQDFILGQRPDYYLTTCKNVAQRVSKFYKRKSKVIYPGVDLNKFDFTNQKSDNYFLLVSRLVDHKKVDLAVKAFNQLGWKLKIAGTGRNQIKLKLMAKNNIEFLGQVADDQLIKLYQKCRAVIFPQVEDFGLVPIEAQACGRPVIAYKDGGALETVAAGKTGEFFYPQTAEALIKVLQDFEPNKYSPKNCRLNAEKFSQSVFKDKLQKLVQYMLS